MTEPLPTGIEILDRKLGGGVPPGRLAVVSAAPASQSEALLYEFATGRSSLYVTTIRPTDQVEPVLDEARAERAEREERRSDDADDYDVVAVEDDRALEFVELVRQLPRRSHVVVDPTRPLEARDEEAYREFLVDLRAALAATESVGYLHSLAGASAPPNRELTEYVADVVFDVTTERRGDSVETHLSVPKFRGGAAPEDVIKLDLSTGVSVDFSRNIV